MWWVFGGKGDAGSGAAEDDIARGEAYGDGSYRPGWPLRDVRGRVRLPGHDRRQRLELDATGWDINQRPSRTCGSLSPT